MPDAGSVTRWIDLLRAGDGEAARALWGRYFDDMVRHARRRLGGRPLAVADGEDVAIEAFASFCRDVARGRFPRLDGRLGLSRLLLTMISQKANDLMRAEGAAKRGSPATGHEAALGQAAGREPPPEFAAEMAEECERLLAKLDGEEQRLIAVRKMEGHTNAEIAALLGCVERTVERGLKVIRKHWEGEMTADKTVAHTGGPAAAPTAPPGYEILGELGRGGMGVVYKARHLGLGRVCALKMILSGTNAGTQELARFRTEGQAIASLQHPNIVQIFEVGEHLGLPFMALEYCAGGSLDARLAQGPLPPREAASLAARLAGAMQAAHAANVIHRDLKPANVLLAADGTPKITDFGLAKRLDESGLTSTGAVMGTFRYMAPEQARGDKGVGPLADVYGLGAILYECLTGGPPFAGGSAAGLLHRVLTEDPTSPRSLRPAIDADLDAVCVKCLEKSPARRYASAAALAHDLDNFLNGRPTDRPDSASRGRETELYFHNVALAEREWADAPQRAGQLLDACRPDLRGWEWRCLKGLLGGRWLTLSEHQDVVYSVAFSPDGTRLISAGDDQALCLRDARTGALLDTISGHADQIYSVCFSPDGLRVAGASQAGVVKVWDLASRATRELTGHGDVVVGVAWSPDGGLIASASDDRTVRLWDAATGAATTLAGHEGFVNAVAFSPDGKTLASASNDRTVILWDTASGAERARLLGHDAHVWSVAFSPDGQLVASGGGGTAVRLWEAASGQEAGVLRGHAGPVHAVVFLDAARLASAGEDKTVRIWDVQSCREAVTLRGHIDDVRGLAVSPDGRRLASCGDDRTVRVWDATEEDAPGPAVLLTVRDHAGPVRGVAFSPDGSRLASCGDDLTARVWDARTGAARNTFRGHEALVTSVTFSPDGRALVSGSGDKTIRLWDEGGGSKVLRGHADRIYRVAFSPDGTRLASAAWDRTVRVWDVATGAEAFAPCRHTNWVWDVAFSACGRMLASSGTDRVVRVWDAATGATLGVLPPQPLKVLGVAFGPCGGVIASAGGDGVVRLWGWPGGTELAALEGHAGRVYKVAFSPDGMLLASAGEDQTVRVWGVREAREVLALRGHTRAVNAVAFRPDGAALASASDDGTVKVWDIGTRAG